MLTLKNTAIPVRLHHLAQPPKQLWVSQPAVTGDTEAEQIIIDLIRGGVTDGNDLQMQSGLDITIYNQSLTMLEIQGKIRPTGANHWSL